MAATERALIRLDMSIQLSGEDPLYRIGVSSQFSAEKSKYNITGMAIQYSEEDAHLGHHKKLVVAVMTAKQSMETKRVKLTNKCF